MTTDKPTWIVVNGNRVDIVKKPAFTEEGTPNASTGHRAKRLKEAFEDRGYEVEGPYAG